MSLGFPASLSLRPSCRPRRSGNQCSRNTHFQRNASPSEGEPAQAPQGQGPQTSQDPNAERAESSHETANHQEEGNFSQRNPENPRREARGPQAT